MTSQEKISTGANDRSRDASIGQSAEGLPDDSGTTMPVDDAEVEAVRRKLGAGGGADHGADTDQQDARQALKRQVDEEIKASERGSE